MSEHVIRVVLDTNQTISAGSSWIELGLPATDKNVQRRILIRVAESHAGLYCGKIIGEYLEKLVDTAHPPERALKLVTYIMGAFDRITITTATAPHPPSDPDDEIFLLCAMDGLADYLVSDDHALVNLKSKYSTFVIGRSVDLAKSLGV